MSAFLILKLIINVSKARERERERDGLNKGGLNDRLVRTYSIHILDAREMARILKLLLIVTGSLQRHIYIYLSLIHI